MKKNKKTDLDAAPLDIEEELDEIVEGFNPRLDELKYKGYNVILVISAHDPLGEEQSHLRYCSKGSYYANVGAMSAALQQMKS